MAGGIDWFRWHHGSVTDPKFAVVAKKSGASVAEVIGVWACLLEAASSSEDRGNPGEPDFESIDCLLGLDDGMSRRIYERMRERSLLDVETGRVASWEKRQTKREDDGAAERKRRQREREQAAAECVTGEESRRVTLSHAEDTACHNREEESREEKKDSLREDGSVASPVGSAAKGARLPADWEPGDEGRAFALGLGIDGRRFDEEAAKFCDYWHAQPGVKGRKANWQATWRNWCRNAGQQRGRAPPQAEPEWRREQRERNEAFLGPAAARRNRPDTFDTETIDATPGTLG